MRFNEFGVLNEGITKSYSANQVEQYLQKSGFGKNDYSFADAGQLALDIKIPHASKYQKVVQTLENVLGWLLVGAKEDDFSPITQEPFAESLKSWVDDIENSLKYQLKCMQEEGECDDDESYGSLHFEAKYSDVINKEDLPDRVYHVTDERLLPKIQKQGLLPKAGSKKTKHPDRIYLFANTENIKGLLDNPEIYIDSAVVLTIDISDFKKTTKFYVDPFLVDGGMYVLKNIPPNLIVDYRTWNYN